MISQEPQPTFEPLVSDGANGPPTLPFGTRSEDVNPPLMPARCRHHLRISVSLGPRPWLDQDGLPFTEILTRFGGSGMPGARKVRVEDAYSRVFGDHLWTWVGEYIEASRLPGDGSRRPGDPAAKILGPAPSAFVPPMQEFRICPSREYVQSP